MPVYTKTGDKGETSLFGGKRVPKYNSQIEANGSVDELSSLIGLVISLLKSKKDKEFLTLIQKDLYEMMGTLCGATVSIEHIEPRIDLFEKRIDEYDRKLTRLRRFILPQGSELTGWFHILRTVCRRSERHIVALFNQKNIAIDRQKRAVIVQYLNRLSDLFFMMARQYGKGREIST